MNQYRITYSAKHYAGNIYVRAKNINSVKAFWEKEFASTGATIKEIALDKGYVPEWEVYTYND